ncbi:MAG: ABC transporter ATP-binding protein [Planctomycetes bacterium]|nr:ABC transporter ATP-binding protein [Planctomycetota bacterium]
MIAIRNLTKTYRRGPEPVVACSVHHLDIQPGEQVALIGRSGTGKTTLLHLIAGILVPDAGSIEVDGVPVHQLSEGQRDRFRAATLGLVFQTFNLLQPFTALENVLLGAVFSQGGGHGPREHAEQLLQRVGLGDRMHHRPSELSVGQQQRVAICRALVHDPKVVLADEPLGNQDKATGREVLQLLLELAREGGKTVVMVTHDPESAAALQRTVDLTALRRAS